MTLDDARALIARCLPGARRLGGALGRLLGVERQGPVTRIYTPGNLLTVRGGTVRVELRAIQPAKEPDK